MTVFVSYSSRDRDAVKSLTQDLQDADEQVWMDQRLAGGDPWWRAILEQIRGCDVFIFALSQNSIQSRPCQAELRYAQALGVPILPVQVGPVDSMQLNPLAAVQAVDYRHSTSNTGMRLISALNRTRALRQPLASPLPDEPEVPFEYLIRLYTTVTGPDQLSPRDQAALVAQLQVGLREDGDHDAARNDILVLLRKLRDREDVTYRTRTDVDVILASVDAESRAQTPTATDASAVGYPPSTLDPTGSGHPPMRPFTPRPPPPAWQSPASRPAASQAKLWVGFGAAGLVALVLVVITVALKDRNGNLPSSAPPTTPGVSAFASSSAPMAPPSAAAPTSTQMAGMNGTEYTVEGPMLAKWETLNDEQKKDLGAPYDNQKNTRDNSGVYQQYDGGVLIYRNGGPVYFVWGKIRDAWNDNQASQGALGYPTADEATQPDGSFKQTFEHGTISWKTGDPEASVINYPAR